MQDIEFMKKAIELSKAAVEHEMNLLELFLLRTERLYLPTKIRFIQNMTLLFMERLV